MLKLPFQLLLTIAILVAFIGQTMAYHFMVSYDLTLEQHSQTQQQIFDIDSVDTSENIDDCCDVECCENECICPVNACASIAYLTNYLNLSEIALLSEPMLLLAIKDTRFIATYLYRPPILPRRA